MAVRDYSKNNLLDMEIRFKAWPDVVDMLDTINSLQTSISYFEDELQELKLELTDVLETAHDDLVLKIEKCLEVTIKDRKGY